MEFNRASYLRIIVATALVLVFGCGSKSSLDSDGKTYKYENPDSGKVVSLRPATEPAPLNRPVETSKETTQLQDANIQLDRAAGTVTVKVTRNLYDDKGALRSTDRITLAGKFEANAPARLRDVDAKQFGGPRLLGFAECVADRYGQACATLFVNVIYDSENNFKQFHAVFPGRPRTPRPSNGPKGTTPTQPSSSAQATGVPTVEETTVNPIAPQTDAETAADDPEYETVEVLDDGSKPKDNDENEFDEGGSPVDEGGSGSFVTGDVTSDWEEVKTILPNPYVKRPARSSSAPANPWAAPGSDGANSNQQTGNRGQATPNPGARTPRTPAPRDQNNPGQSPPAGSKYSAPPPGSASGGQPQTTSGIPLKLTGGGTAKNSHENGYIENTGTLFPTTSPGARRASPDGRAYGNGFSVEFMEQSTRQFTMANPECGTFVFNQISKANGGFLSGHKTHYNGLDYDISFFGNPGTHYAHDVRVKQRNSRTGRMRTVTIGKLGPARNFPYGCFLKYTKFMYDQKFKNVGGKVEGTELVDLIWVNQAIQDDVCQYVKTNNLKSQYGEALSLIYPWSGHTSHFHVRLRCSPKHNGCYARDLDRRLPYQKRGCRNL